MPQIPIKRAIESVPGGMMVVPLLLGAVINTFFPGTPKLFGSFTGALFTGALPILAVFYVCMGASIDFKATPSIVLGIIFGRPEEDAAQTEAGILPAGAGGGH